MSHRIVAAVLLVLSSPVMVGAVDHRSNFDARVLASHNRERSGVGVPPLSWNAELAASAAVWARHLARTGEFRHSPNPPNEAPQGENLWAGTPGRFAPEAMVRLWVDEKRHFKPGTFPNNSRSGHVEDVSHYTQLMWRRSGEVGCAVARGRSEEFLVCRYQTAGNVIGQIPY
jgi:hypothetical protein